MRDRVGFMFLGRMRLLRWSCTVALACAVLLSCSRTPSAELTVTATATATAENGLAYSYTPHFSPTDFEASLVYNRALWDSKDITHYTIRVKLPFSGYYRLPWTVEVNKSQVVSISDVMGNALLPSDIENYDKDIKQFLSVPDLFSFVEARFQEQPLDIKVVYDSQFGYPSSIYVDPFVEPCCMDYRIFVDHLTVLP